jgi:magnesium-protoporphyrin IX monomethyl ester (oxidative) cyclase
MSAIAEFMETDFTQRLVDSVESAADANKKAVTNTVLAPRFYTTNFDEMDKINISSVRREWDLMMQEYEGDNNHDHFQRDAAFKDEVHTLMSKLDDGLKQEFYDFLIGSLTSEFSGCILYNEVRKNVANPDIKKLMTFMARDESRHAGFLNQSLKDFNFGIDLGQLKRTKKYTFFQPKFIFYATYLSEKIGYARYITIFRQLEKNPDKRFHPIFRWFERWCNDEFRHGESFALIMRADPRLLKGLNLWWIRFFIIAVYATMYVRDHTRPALHDAMGLNATQYDFEVFRITSEISKQVFPLIVDIDNPKFKIHLERLTALSFAMNAAKERKGVLNILNKGWIAAQALTAFVKLYFLPVIKSELPAQVRLVPTW